MPIYETVYDVKTKEALGPSTDSGFSNFEEVKAAMGKPFREGPRLLLYTEFGLAYSDYKFR